NPMSATKVMLGCRLFFDTRLSINGVYSCATCHRPELAFTDGRALAIGTTGETVRRSSMSLTNVAYNPAYNWASDKTVTLESQITRPLFGKHPVEMGLREGDSAVLATLAKDQYYSSAFHQSFPNESTPLSMANLVKAIAAFERTLISGRSTFDRYVFDDDRVAMSASAQRGMALFYAKAGCADCHSGINFSGPIVHAQSAGVRPSFANTGLYNQDGRGRYPDADLGLIEESGKASDMGKFRVPSLRNIALTAPYMHDGSVTTLEDVLAHYATGGRQSPHGHTANNRYKDSNIRALALDEREKREIIAFLHSLTDADFINAPKNRCAVR
ncbi:MAG: di-heme enzyme, partial [Candidatus Obscuribacterales bacterium]|nr:di-heme enzyme [Steroidobacteraceae bacterium]